MIRLAIVCAALLAGSALSATAAMAQIGGGTGPKMPLTSPQSQQGAKGGVPDRAPAALPGAASAAAAGPKVGTAGMRPNDALFDSVNRGDIVAVREALGRGADVDARNVLGLTPVELSVDLGRNDITFLLLSMRGSGSAGRAAPPSARPAAAGRVAATPVATGSISQPRVAAQPRPAAAPLPGRDPGVPAPQAGFLGFGASR